MGFGTTEILIIAGVIVLLFGAGAIPKFARNVGKAKKEFEKGLQEGSSKDAEGDQPKEDAPAQEKKEQEREA